MAPRGEHGTYIHHGREGRARELPVGTQTLPYNDAEHGEGGDNENAKLERAGLADGLVGESVELRCAHPGAKDKVQREHRGGSGELGVKPPVGKVLPVDGDNHGDAREGGNAHPGRRYNPVQFTRRGGKLRPDRIGLTLRCREHPGDAHQATHPEHQGQDVESQKHEEHGPRALGQRSPGRKRCVVPDGPSVLGGGAHPCGDRRADTTVRGVQGPPAGMLRRLVCFVAVLGVSGCRWHHGSDVVLAEVAAVTGERAPWGEDLHRGIALAVEQQNAHGGINGQRIRLTTADDQSHDEHAGSLAARLCEREGPIALFGEVSSVACERAAAAAGRRGVPFISPASASRDLARAGDHSFRIALTDTEQAQAIARHARLVLQRHRGAIVYRRSSLLPVSLADAFARAFSTGGGEVTLRDSYSDDTELVRLAGRVRASNADVVYVPADATDAGHIAVALRQARVTAQILGSDGWSSPEVRQYAQDAAIGALYTDAFSPNVPRPEVDAFVSAFRTRYDAMPGTFAALGYDAVRWALRAAARAPQLDAHALGELLPNSRLDDGVAGPFAVDPHRTLIRSVYVIRIERDGIGVVGTASP